MERAIKQVWCLPHPPKKVWLYLTDSKLLSRWLMENDFEPVVGHKFRFDTKPKIKLGFDGIIYCEVLEVIPEKRLSYSWKGGSAGKTTLDSVVIWTLEPLENGTQLSLEHKGFKGLKNFLPYFFMSKGWETRIRRRLENLLAADGTE